VSSADAMTHVHSKATQKIRHTNYTKLRRMLPSVKPTMSLPQRAIRKTAPFVSCKLVVVWVSGVIYGFCSALVFTAHISLPSLQTSEYLLRDRTKYTANGISQRALSLGTCDRKINADDGWGHIHVFYGDRRHLPYNSVISNDYFSEVQWFGQRLQDLVVSKLTRGKRGGFFIDLAANDPVKISNSYALETFYDWKGLCLEPNPQYWAGLAFRKCDVVAAVVGKETMEEISFRFPDLGPRGGIVGNNFDNKQKGGNAKFETIRDLKLVNIDIPKFTVKLEDIFERFQTPHVIDFLSLDIEGAEEFVMTHFPFETYRFNIMCVERPSHNLQTLLTSHGYKMLKWLHPEKDTLWVHVDALSSIDLDLTALEIDTEHYKYRERVPVSNAIVKKSA
jgi:hypothetical protein